MTVASLAIASFGAASNAFLMGSVVCATALVETASTPSTNREISFMESSKRDALKIYLSKNR
jgi:hypothetical protein